MGFIIEDGTGKGYSARVNSDNHLEVSSISSTVEHYTNHIKGRAYNVNVSATPSAGACFFYMKNTDVDRALIIEGFDLYMEADDYVEFYFDKSGTPVGGNTITPVNLNTRSGLEADGTFLSANSITGLSGGKLIQRYYHPNYAGTVDRNFNQDIILDTNGIFTAHIGTGTAALYMTLDINFHPLS